VDEAGAVGRGKPAASLAEGVEDTAPGARLGAQPEAERSAVDEVHDDEDLGAVRADVVHGDHVRVLEARHRLGFAEEAIGEVGAPLRGAHFGPQELESNATIELGVIDGVDAAHRALTDEIEDGVPADPLASLETDRARLGRRTAGRRRRGEVEEALGGVGDELTTNATDVEVLEGLECVLVGKPPLHQLDDALFGKTSRHACLGGRLWPNLGISNRMGTVSRPRTQFGKADKNPWQRGAVGVPILASLKLLRCVRSRSIQRPRRAGL
jgi:hypothetical protein